MTLAQEIMSGDHDYELEILAQAILKRRRIIGEIRAASLKVGDRVRIEGVGMGAKYLNGMTATVTGFATKNVKVQIDPEFDTRRYSHNMRMPPTLLRAIDVEPPKALVYNRPDESVRNFTKELDDLYGEVED